MKRLLILEACGIEGEEHECNGICSQAKLYGIDVTTKNVSDNEDLEEILHSNGSFDYIYLSSHGDIEGFGNESGTVDYPWSDFATLLCESYCMNDNCIIMLSCCRAGLNQVAYTLFANCNHVSYVVGPRQSLSPYEMHICFGIFFYSVEIRQIDPVVACEKIKAATDQRFSCYDREEVPEETYIHYLIKDSTIDKEGIILNLQETINFIQKH